jgi:hypothetical protein
MEPSMREFRGLQPHAGDLDEFDAAPGFELPPEPEPERRGTSGLIVFVLAAALVALGGLAWWRFAGSEPSVRDAAQSRLHGWALDPPGRALAQCEQPPAGSYEIGCELVVVAPSGVSDRALAAWWFRQEAFRRSHGLVRGNRRDVGYYAIYSANVMARPSSSAGGAYVALGWSCPPPGGGDPTRNDVVDGIAAGRLTLAQALAARCTLSPGA